VDAPTPEEVERQLAQLAHQPVHERAAKLTELGWSHPGRPLPGLLPFLEDSAPLVRVAAAQARWQTAARPEELDRLVRILVESLGQEDEELALTAGTALVNMEEAAVAPLIESYNQEGGEQALVVRVLGEIGGDEAIAFLGRVTDSPDPAVAREATEGLQALAEEMGGESMIPLGDR